ncbi:MAG: DUF2520 domain-containing protein [candidate division WOR-3 bacterium]|jgi:predicted short-subunit dehydrogenase-like oxidoreductase (DUF2520 family)
MEKLSIIGFGRFGKIFRKNYEKCFEGKRIFYIYDKRFKRNLNLSKLFSSDIILVSVNDDSITEVLKIIKDFDKEVILVSGSYELKHARKILKRASNVSIFHPIQSFQNNDKPEIFKNIYATCESDKKSNFIDEFCERNSIKLLRLKDIDRKKYHLSSMFALNYTLTLLSISENLFQISTSQNFEIKPFLPALQTLIKKLGSKKIKDVITGPSVRRDTKLIHKISKSIDDREIKKLFLILDRITREKLK